MRILEDTNNKFLNNAVMRIFKLMKRIWKRILTDVLSQVIAGFFLAVLAIIGVDSFKESQMIVLPYPIKVWILCIIVIVGIILWMLYFYWIKKDFKYDEPSYNNDKELYEDMIERLPASGSISFLRSNDFEGIPFTIVR